MYSRWHHAACWLTCRPRRQQSRRTPTRRRRALTGRDVRTPVADRSVRPPSLPCFVGLAVAAARHQCTVDIDERPGDVLVQRSGDGVALHVHGEADRRDRRSGAQRRRLRRPVGDVQGRWRVTEATEALSRRSRTARAGCRAVGRSVSRPLVCFAGACQARRRTLFVHRGRGWRMAGSAKTTPAVISRRGAGRVRWSAGRASAARMVAAVGFVLGSVGMLAAPAGTAPSRGGQAFTGQLGHAPTPPSLPAASGAYGHTGHAVDPSER